jgi:hypothetical protein
MIREAGNLNENEALNPSNIENFAFPKIHLKLSKSMSNL